MMARRSKRASTEPIAEEELPISPELRQAFTDLVMSCTELIIKVACCDCKQRDNCAVFEKAREIAIIVDRISELRRGLIRGAN